MGAECLFCRIVAGSIPAKRVYEDDLSLAFADINPQAPVHVLVIPKVHYPDIGSLAAAQPQTAADVLREAAEVAFQENGDKGFRVVFNTGAGVGQTVFHAHAHVLGGRSFHWPPG